MNRRYLYISLATGILTPSLAILMLEVFFSSGRSSPYRPSPVQGFDPFLLVLSMVPFVVVTAVISVVGERRRPYAFWGGLIGAWGFTVYGHATVWYPLFVPGRRMSSTAVIAFLFIPFYALIPMAIGLLVGWGVSFLPLFQEGKKNKPAREEGEDDKFSL